jgi:hypothetical protein
LPVNNTIIEGNFFEYQVAAYDADIEQVNISAVSLPSWLSHNASDNKLSGTPTHQNIGNNQVILRLDDTHVTVDSTFILEVLLNTGIDDPENDNSMIYPNPASKYFHIKTNLVISGILSFRLYTTDGDVVISKHILQENETIYLDDYSLQPGIYIYEITDKNTMAFKGKLVVTPTAHEW